jgi:queuosine precursor transporter
VRSNHRYLPYIQAIFISVLLVINLVSASKVSLIQFTLPLVNHLVSFPIGTGILFFPISYLIGDLLTEVYGYSISRRVIWTGFGVLIFSTLMIQFVVNMPPAPGWPHQKAFEEVFAVSPRMAASSIVAFAAGEFANSFVLAKMKVLTGGSKLWARTIGSTICGEALDTLIFYPLAFLGNPDFSLGLLGSIMLVNYLGKVTWEVIATPLTYVVVGWLKKAEGEDYFDKNTDFNPFHLAEG